MCREAASIDPLDLSQRPPRAPRETSLGCMFLPRTIDKLRAELPGGNIGDYLNHDTGLSAYVVRRLGLDMGSFREAVARARDEDELEVWLRERIDLAHVDPLGAKLETFVASRMTPEDRVLVRERPPVMAQRPDLDRLLDIIAADDELASANRR